ncbi:response regulator [Sedimenticola selenatireducens]|jgi:twitching motility two-component system response regulator PilH|uniref:Response regulator n=1 Tax=Sedimenticola selenatireducens TaxID=191960 RepID=A0A557S0F2_9GAMM|nr:response regulator [Sedimenticola selenatireducens]TVO70839.1 response regulator [Sedimenticola selenatireducens]TVT65759.1 MAG: response regulator [Sedimenticola selenatireducens]
MRSFFKKGSAGQSGEVAGIDATILIVDDSPTETHILKGIVEGGGYKVITAVDGESGLTVAKESKPDLVLMDVVMPGLNGFQATRQLSKAPETQDIPVIVVTTKDQETDRAWGLRQGAKDYVVKPVAAEELLSKIKAVLAG